MLIDTTLPLKVHDVFTVFPPPVVTSPPVPVSPALIIFPGAVHFMVGCTPFAETLKFAILGAVSICFMLAAISSGLALSAVATPISVMAAAISLQPAWKDCWKDPNSLFNQVNKARKGLNFMPGYTGRKEKNMNKEKITFGTQTLEYDTISEGGGLLKISVNDGDMTALETMFSCDREDLEKITQKSADDQMQRVFKNYDIFKSIQKDKDVVINESTEETADIVTVTLQQESAVEIAIRKLQAGQAIQDGAIDDLAVTISDMATGELSLETGAADGTDGQQ